MAINRARQITGYGLSDALPNIFPSPVVSTRDPQAGDRAQLGTVWVNKSTNDFFVLTSVAANVSTWSAPSNGTGIFTSLEATSGNITADAGNIVATLGDVTVLAGDINATSGNISAGGTITATGNLTTTSGDLVVTVGNVSVTLGNLTVSAGDITATAGGVDASAGSIIGGSIEAADDLGGTVGNTTFTNATNTTQGVGALGILSTNGNAGNNAGFLKIYVGSTTAYIPYFTNIAP